MLRLAANNFKLDLNQVNSKLTGAGAVPIVRWAYETFTDKLVMTSSFGVQSAVMLHLVTKVIPDIPVILIDTGFLFPETYRFVDELTNKLRLNLKIYQPKITAARLTALRGELWNQGQKGMDEYLNIAKVEPMQRALKELGAGAWLAGLRGEQTNMRANLKTVGIQDGRYKFHPILQWSKKDVHQYLKANGLPYHPLYAKGYASIGDVHSTMPITAGMDERQGRFKGLKQECGIHLPASKEESQSRDSSVL